MNRVDWAEKLQHFVQVLAFCLVIATIQYAFEPDKPYGPPVVYSLFIGTTIWAIIDIGRVFFPSSADTGWPKGISGVVLVAAGIAGGWFLGNNVADHLCRIYGFYPEGYQPRNPVADLRNSVLALASERLEETRALADHHLASGSPLDVEDFASTTEIVQERLGADDVFAGLERLDRMLGVQVVGRVDANDLHRRIAQHLLVRGGATR